MFTHIVFFKLKDNAKENVDKVCDILNSMKGNIPELKDLEVGEDVLNTERSFDISLITRFEDKLDYETYAKSRYHVNVVLSSIKELIKETKTVDYNK